MAGWFEHAPGEALRVPMEATYQGQALGPIGPCRVDATSISRHMLHWRFPEMGS